MSILGSSSNHSMGTLHELKKQASFFLKEKIRTARLALTDVTPTQLLTEEATDENPWAPDTRTMGLISRAAFEVDDYWRIVEILHKRLVRFDRKNWRVSYKALILLEHLLMHGPESFAEEFQSDRNVIQEMGSFQYIDERGFNWGLTVRKKSERILKLLENGPLLKEERDRARKLTRGIQGFGSFSQRTSVEGCLRESSSGMYGRCNSHYTEHGDQGFELSNLEGGPIDTEFQKTQEAHKDTNSVSVTKDRNSVRYSSDEDQILEKLYIQTSHKAKATPTTNELLAGDFSKRECTKELKPLLNGERDEPKTGYSIEAEHPFNNTEHQSSASLLISGH